MAKNSFESAGRIALFRTAESEPGEPALDNGASMVFDSGSNIQSAIKVEHDGETVRGSELPTQAHARERETAGTLAQKRARPDFIAFALAYFFGSCVSETAGATARLHAISAADSLFLPSFTALLRRGQGLFTERIAGNYVESFSIAMGEGWVSASCEIVGTGHRETTYAREIVAAPANAASITLAANAVRGDDDLERLAGVFRVRAKDTGSQVWQTLAVASVSGDAPAQIMFETPLGASGEETDYQVDYAPVEPAWCVFPDYVDESPLKLTDARVVVDGYYDGATLAGGEELKGEVAAFSITGKNNLELRRFAGATGPAAEAVRGPREISVSLTESLFDSIRAYQADHPETETVSLALVVEGAEIDPGGERFGVEIIFPRCALVESSLGVLNRRLSREGSLLVLDDGVYGGVVVRCRNRQNSYL